MNRNELRAEIARQGISIGDFCREAEIAQSTYHRKMQDPETAAEKIPEFTQGEISRIRKVLQLSDQDVIRIFFAPEVS